MRKERYYLLPSVPTRGHGLVLLLFWTLAFIGENLTFVNMKQDDWWFKFTSLKDRVEMSLFVMRYISYLLIFVLGLKAPGILTHREDDYIHLQNDNNAENRSTWTNSWRKMRTLAPFMWPKKSFILQLNVIMCIALVIFGRIINVYVPVYSQKIGKKFIGD